MRVEEIAIPSYAECSMRAHNPNAEHDVDILSATASRSACQQSGHHSLEAPLLGLERMTSPKSSEARALSVAPTSTDGVPAGPPELQNPIIGADPGLPVAPSDLEKLARWVPKKEMALLVEICERARCDGDLARPALLLCRAYGKRVARMLDQDPFPTVTQQITDRLRQLRVQNGL
jgi:hypothetical protein